MSEPKNDVAPHDCPECGEPSYLGFGVPARCVSRGCVFYDRGLWADYVMALPDDGMPEGTEPDFFDLEEEPTNPGFGTPRLSWASPTPYDTWGAVLGKPRKPGEPDADYVKRLLDAFAPSGGGTP